MFRSKILWAFVLGIITCVLILEARINLGYSPLWSRVVEVLGAPGAYFANSIFPSGVPSGGWAKFFAALAFTCNFLIYTFFWYACIWIASYLRERQHPYDRQSTLVPPSLR
jgi:hypothetical protein